MNANTTKTCRCGCSTEISKRSTYAPGHDAKHVSLLLPVLRTAILNGADGSPVEPTELKLAELFGQLGSPALRAKLGRAFDNETDLKQDEGGYYNTSGDAGILVPFSENPSLGLHTHSEATLAAYAAIGWSPTEGVLVVEKAAKAPKAPKAEKAVSSTRGGVVEYTMGEVKVGRWTYPTRTANGVTQRNEKRDGSGAWITV